MLKNNISNGVKILITTGIFPPDIGGPATQLDYLIKEILARESFFKFTVLTFGEKGGNYPYDVYKISKKTPKIFKNLFYLFKTISLSGRSDIIYSWDLYAAGLSSFLAKKVFWRKKLIIRFVGDSAWENYFSKSQNKIFKNSEFSFDDILKFQDKKYGLYIEFRKWIRKKMLLAADIVVVPSGFMKEAALKIGVSEQKIKLIYNSVDFLFDENIKKDLENTTAQTCRNELGIGEENINLVSVSRLTPWKGHKMIIDLMSELAKEYTNIKFFIIGDGPEYNNLESQISNLKLEKTVFLKGKLEHKEVFKYLKCADIFLLNTAYEGLSHVLLETMTVGIPVITTNLPSNMELIENGKNGFLVDYNDKQGFYGAITKIIKEPELKQKFLKESENKLKNFTFEKLASQTINVFNELI